MCVPSPALQRTFVVLRTPLGYGAILSFNFFYQVGIYSSWLNSFFINFLSSRGVCFLV